MTAREGSLKAFLLEDFPCDTMFQIMLSSTKASNCLTVSQSYLLAFTNIIFIEMFLEAVYNKQHVPSFNEIGF